MKKILIFFYYDFLDSSFVDNTMSFLIDKEFIKTSKIPEIFTLDQVKNKFKDKYNDSSNDEYYHSQSISGFYKSLNQKSSKYRY